ncbi:hypothetical protein GCM10009677_55130 [Sphaerisporangium rubeum]|uniref:Uncharacterized protein n=1 Tax=Sphaerisporangium rubeum TaxID=321317 RepID=A0A7X0M8X7_9ACTN|nr:hypothetical protein [Sphaerisporangium rubeum]MBB6474469.1 hypothetical protein [Sphaerisporangium rubeum]
MSRLWVVVAAVVVLAGGGVAAFVLTRPETGPSPAVYRGEPTSALYEPIATRAAGSRPLTVQEVFTTEEVRAEGVTMARRGTEASDDCGSALWGSGVAEAASGCARVVRAGYESGDGRVCGQYAVFDLPDGAAADRLVAALEPARRGGFLRPAPGPACLDAAHSRAQARALGHFVVVNWVGAATGAGEVDLAFPQLALESLAGFAQRRVLEAADGAGP